MKLLNWKKQYAWLAVLTVLVVLVFASKISRRHVATIASLGIAIPLALAWLGGHFESETEMETIESGSPPSGGRWFGLTLFVVACLKFVAVGFGSSQFIPSLHDEWSYLFGAETLARGHLSNPTPPYPEFFDAFHVLCTPRWVTRYPPGHPAALAFGVLVGWPPAIVIAATAGAVVLIFLLARELAGESVARLAGVLAVMAPGLDYLAGSYLSQSTFLFAITGSYAATVAGVRRRSWRLLAVAGLAGGWAILTRPYSAGALGVPLAVWFLIQLFHIGAARGSALLVAAAIPIATLLGLFAVYNQAIMGSPWRTAWGEYNRQFEPDNTLGFLSGTPRPIPASIDSRKAERARGIAQEKMQFTPVAAARRALANPQRLCDIVFSALGFYGLAVFVPFGLLYGSPGSVPSRAWRWLLVLAPLAHYVAYAFFYSTWGAYPLETIPFVVLLVALGQVEFWRHARESDRPGLTLVVPLFLLVSLVVDVRELGRLMTKRQHETAYHRDFIRKLSRLEEPSIVFVRLDPTRVHRYDLINNSPDLTARVLVVLDLGERNADLLAEFPGRAAYLYDESTGQLIPWVSTRPGLQARWPIHPPPTVANGVASHQATRRAA